MSDLTSQKCVPYQDEVDPLKENEIQKYMPMVHGWNKVKLTLFTHKIKGLHLNDFILAAKINKLSIPILLRFATFSLQQS